MFITAHTIKTNEELHKIWQVLTDVENWKDWDKELVESKIEGPFQTGTKGTLKFKTGPILETELTHVDPSKRVFVQEAKIFLAKVVMTHAITQHEGKVKVTFQTEIKGFLALPYKWMLGSSIKKKIPTEMEAMLKIVSS